jgi:TRAP-type C4-dicarboxylate transport system permease small subunit
MFKFVKLFDNWTEKLSSWLLVLVVLVMLVLSVLVIVFRWMSITSFWLEPLNRHLVFICTFLGGVIATGRGTHIGIDIIGKYMEDKGKVNVRKYIDRLICITAIFTLGWLIKASYDFVLVELQYGKIAFLKIHSGVLVGITPVGFLLIGVRFFTRFILSFSKEFAPVKEEQSC